MQIIALNDTNDPSFLADEQTAINIYQSLYSTDYITVTIRVGYGDWDGQPLPDQNKSISDVNMAAVQILDYATLRKDLLTYGMGPAFFNNTNLPPPGGFVGPDGTRTPPNFWVSSAVAKIFGLPTNGAVDGTIGIGTGFAPGAARVCAFLHEIGHALGRYPENTINPLNGLTAYSELDLWRFTSQGNRLWDGNTSTAPAAYFSLDGGATKLADWGQTSDPSDFRGPDSNPASNLTPNDPFNENDSNHTDLTNTDFGVMDALGFTTTVVVPPAPDPPVAGITDPHPKVKIEAAAHDSFPASSLFTASASSLPHGSHVPLAADTGMFNPEHPMSSKEKPAGLHGQDNLGNINYVGDAAGSDKLYVTAVDGKDWSANASLTATTIGTANVNHAPIVTAHDVTVDTGTPVSLSSLFGANDPDGDSITQYMFMDDRSSGHFENNGVILASHTWQRVDAADLSKINYVGDTAGSDKLYVTAYDGKDWSANATFTATAVGPAKPEVSGHDMTVAANTPVAITSLFTAHQANDSITQYWFMDDGSAGGHLEVGGKQMASHAWIPVDAANLGSVNYVPGAGAGSELLHTTVFDGHNWSANASATVGWQM